MNFTENHELTKKDLIPMDKGITLAFLIRKAVDKLVENGTIAKQEAFALECKQTLDQFKQRIHSKTYISLPEYWVYRDVIERLDPEIGKKLTDVVNGQIF